MRRTAPGGNDTAGGTTAGDLRQRPRHRLKIGYVSPEFRFVTFFLEPLLKHHDRRQIELFCLCGGELAGCGFIELTKA